MKLFEIADYGKAADGDNEYKVTYTTNRGKDSNTRKVHAKSKKDAVKFVLKTLGTPVKIDGKDVDLGKLDKLD